MTKALNIFWLGLLCATTHAAVSDHLFPLRYTWLAGVSGNVVFNGNHFVTPTVQSGGGIQLGFLDTNCLVLSNSSLIVTGNSPCIAFDSGNYYLTWLDTNLTLFCAHLTNQALSETFAVATNVSTNATSIRASRGNLLVLWQSAGSNSAVFARWIATNASPLTDAFAVSPSASPQRFPGMNIEGTNHLIAWTEQNVASNDWRVLARFVDDAGPTGPVISVSQTNSMRGYQTACSFGTNFLVAWSTDERITVCRSIAQPPYCSFSNYWFPMVHGRMFGLDGVPTSNEFAIGRSPFTNTAPFIAFDSNRYLIGWANDYGWQSLQPLAADGSRKEYPLPGFTFQRPIRPSIASGAGRFCVLYPFMNGTTKADMVGAQFMGEGSLINLERAPGGGISVESSGYDVANIPFLGPYSFRSPDIVVSSNLVHWTPATLNDLPDMPAGPRLFVRGVNRVWPCTEQKRSLQWAKEQWAVDNFQPFIAEPEDTDLFGPNLYLPAKPQCPSAGTYNILSISESPTCTIDGHLLW